MFEKSIIKNYFFNSGLNILNMIFPILSFPYVSRVLGVEGLGEASFILVFSSYFITLAALGIPIYGIREIAKNKSNKNNLNKIFSELFLLNFLSVIIFSLIYLIVIFSFDNLNSSVALYLLIGINIIFSFFQIDWLFQGLENYKIITIRSFISKLLAFVLMILFVNNEGDIDIYLITNIIALTGANFFNIFYARRYVSLNIKGLNFKRHYESIIYFFTTRIMSSVYTIMDTIILGFLVGNFYVGLYIVAIRLIRAVTVLVTSLSAVLLPRSSEYLENKQFETYNTITSNSFYFILLVSSTISILLFLFSKDIMLMFAGKEFLDSAFTMQLLSILVIFVSLSNFTGVQILYPHKKEKIVAKSITLGAIVSVLFCFLLIPLYKHNGAAIAVLLAELSILLYQFKHSKNIIEFQFDKIRILNILGGIVVCFGIVFVFNLYIDTLSIYFRLSLRIIVFIIVYISIFSILKETLVLNVLKKLKDRL